MSVAAHATPSWSFPLARAFASEVSLRFAIGDSIRDRRRLFTLIAAGILPAADVLEERVSFTDAPRAFERMRAQRILKAAIDPRL